MTSRCELSERDLEQIPSHGPVVIVANHPLGTIDGMALLHAISQVRRDVKIVANRLIMLLEPLNSLMLPVDNIGNRTNRQQLQHMQQHLSNQGVLIIFPAGEVSRLTSAGVRDREWHHSFLRLARKRARRWYRCMSKVETAHCSMPPRKSHRPWRC